MIPATMTVSPRRRIVRERVLQLRPNRMIEIQRSMAIRHQRIFEELFVRDGRLRYKAAIRSGYLTPTKLKADLLALKDRS